MNVPAQEIAIASYRSIHDTFLMLSSPKPTPLPTTRCKIVAARLTVYTELSHIKQVLHHNQSSTSE